jgi:transposase
MSIIKYKTEQEDKSRDELIKDMYKQYKKIKRLEKEKEKLEKEIHKYKNAHTPSSQKKFAKVEVQGLKVGRKKGKKSHHKGRTRVKETPIRIIDVTADQNPLTGNKNIEETGHIEEVTITDFKIVKAVTKYNLHEYLDLNTGEIFTARHPNMPEKGIFGKGVSSFVNLLRWKCRVPFDKIAFTFTHVFNIPMTAPTAMEICNRTADKVSPHYDKLRVDIQKEKAVNGDETGAKRNGLPGWLWGFFSLTIALFVFDAKRGGDIVERVLGKDFKGILGCDGWSTYKVFSKKAGVLLQRCWAHATRELKEICYKKKKPDKSLVKAYEWLCEIFEKVKEARKIKSQEIRDQLYAELVDELNMWIQIYKSYRRLRPFVNKMENGENFWFTCVLHLEIEPTNNGAERGLRLWVVLRKIIGCLRSEQGEKTTQTMLSLFGTWDLRKLNPYEELKAIL